METFFMTDIGKVRSHNEDYGTIKTNSRGDIFAIVADGMGGHRAGDVASHMAVEAFERKWETANFTTPKEAEAWLHNSVEEINRQIYYHSKNNPECDGMGTTLVIAICTAGFITVGHIGDSRCYFFKGDKLSKMTEDHSLVNELVKLGEISQEEAAKHPRKNALLRALGAEETVEMDVQTLEREEEVIIFLCSDGLSNKVDEQLMADILALNVSLKEKGEKLVRLANHLGGEDNITVVLLRAERGGEG